MMLGTILKSMGIKIDATMIETKVNEVIALIPVLEEKIPEFARRATELLASIDSRLGAIEARLTAIENQRVKDEPETKGLIEHDTGTNKPN